MNITTRKGKQTGLLTSFLLTIAAFTVLILSQETSPIHVSAHAGDVFGPACGTALIDGNVNSVEWSKASKKTFQMISESVATPFTSILYVMNSRNNLYMGIVINDDEFSTVGTFLPQGDGFRIDFDNDHSGSLFTLQDDVLGITAGPPQFEDGHISVLPSTATADGSNGGTSDGVGAASRVSNLNHFELRHPLCSGDPLDFCLHPSDTVGFRLEYLDAEVDGSFGGSQYFPGSAETSEADIVIDQCSQLNSFIYLPLIRK